MQFLTTALLFAAAAMALPQSGDGPSNNVELPVNSQKVSLSKAQNTCGNNAKVTCCNKKTDVHDTSAFANGPLAGLLQSISAPGTDGLGLFGQCNDISASVGVLGAAGLQQLVDQKCKQNVACCQNTRSDANGNLVGVAIPCIALSSLL